MNDLDRADKALSLAEIIDSCDNAALRLVAEELVRKNHVKADHLGFFLNAEIHQLLMRFGFSEKINDIV